MKSFACWLLLGDNPSLSHKKKHGHQIGPQCADCSLHLYFTCMWTNSDHPSGGRINHCDLATPASKQSGRKPNLVAKIWPPNLVTICAWLPKLVASVSSQFQHLVNTGLAVGFHVKWLPIMVAHTCKLDTIWVVDILPIGGWNGSIRL